MPSITRRVNTRFPLVCTQHNTALREAYARIEPADGEKKNDNRVHMPMPYLLSGPRTCVCGRLGQKGSGSAKMIRDSEIKGLPGGLNAPRVFEKDHAQASVSGPVPDFAAGHACAISKPLAQNAQKE